MTEVKESSIRIQDVETKNIMTCLLYTSAAEQGGHVPTELVPRCPKCGGPMDIHMGAGQRMIPDAAAQARFQNFLKTYHGKKLVVLELGIRCV